MYHHGVHAWNSPLIAFFYIALHWNFSAFLTALGQDLYTSYTTILPMTIAVLMKIFCCFWILDGNNLWPCSSFVTGCPVFFWSSSDAFDNILAWKFGHFFDKLNVVFYTFRWLVVYWLWTLGYKNVLWSHFLLKNLVIMIHLYSVSNLVLVFCKGCLQWILESIVCFFYKLVSQHENNVGMLTFPISLFVPLVSFPSLRAMY